MVAVDFQDMAIIASEFLDVFQREILRQFTDGPAAVSSAERLMKMQRLLQSFVQVMWLHLLMYLMAGTR